MESIEEVLELFDFFAPPKQQHQINSFLLFLMGRND
jgi:hypothetical protein